MKTKAVVLYFSSLNFDRRIPAVTAVFTYFSKRVGADCAALTCCLKHASGIRHFYLPFGICKWEHAALTCHSGHANRITQLLLAARDTQVGLRRSSMPTGYLSRLAQHLLEARYTHAKLYSSYLLFKRRVLRHNLSR